MTQLRPVLSNYKSVYQFDYFPLTWAGGALMENVVGALFLTGSGSRLPLSGLGYQTLVQRVHFTSMHIVYSANDFYVPGLFQFRNDRAALPDVIHG